MEATRERLENISCDLCGTVNYSFLFTALDNKFHTRGIYNVVECNGCGLCYTNPRPKTNEIGNYYPKGDYFTHKSANTLKRSFRYWVKKCVLKSLYGRGKEKPNKKFIDRIVCFSEEIIATFFKITWQ